MRRSDIQVCVRKNSITMLSKCNQFTFSPAAGEELALFTTSEFTAPMLDELTRSGIVNVEDATYAGDSGVVILRRKFGFDNEKFTNVLMYLIEKYGL